MPKLVRFLARHAALGFIIAAVAVALVMVSDFAKLGTLIMASDVGWLALFMLTFFLGLTLASVQMGIAIILLDERHLDNGRRRRGQGWVAAMLSRPLPASRSRVVSPRRGI